MKKTTKNLIIAGSLIGAACMFKKFIVKKEQKQMVENSISEKPIERKYTTLYSIPRSKEQSGEGYQKAI